MLNRKITHSCLIILAQGMLIWSSLLGPRVPLILGAGISISQANIRSSCQVGSQVRSILDKVGWSCHAHLHSVGNIQSKPLFELDRGNELDPSSDSGRLNCRDHEAAILMSKEIEKIRKDRDTIGSVVEVVDRSVYQQGLESQVV